MLLLALAWTLGDCVTQNLGQLPPPAWLTGIAFTGLLLLTLIRFLTPRNWQLALLFLGIFALSFSYASSRALWRLHDALPHVAELRATLVEGVITSLPQRQDNKVQFRFLVEQPATIPRHVSLSHHLQAGEAPPLYRVGERWRLQVKFKRPHSTYNPHEFDAEGWALAENIRAFGTIINAEASQRLAPELWLPLTWIASMREAIDTRIENVLGDAAHTNIIRALVVGRGELIKRQDREVFANTGVSHLMSISGTHITMLSSLVMVLVAFLWRRVPYCMLWQPAPKAAVLAGLVTALAYTVLSGFAVPAQRTLYMLATLAIAFYFGKPCTMRTSLSCALLVVLILDPWAVLSWGFWLSFCAVAVLTFAFAGRLQLGAGNTTKQTTRWRDKLASGFTQSVVGQWAVTLGLLPLLLLFFHQAPWVSPLANAVAIPLITLAVTPLAMLGSFLPWDLPLHIAHSLLNLGMHFLYQISTLGLWQQPAPPLWTLVPAVLGALCLLLPRGVPLRLLGLSGFLPMLLASPTPLLLGEMQISVLDIGQGLSVFIRTAQHRLLYDTGPRLGTSDAGKRLILPFLRAEGVNKLDGLIVSHNDSDHSGGLESILQALPVDWLLSSLPEPPAEVRHLACQAGQTWTWEEVRFDMLSPAMGAHGKDNSLSCVLKMSSPWGSVLLTGDIERNTEQALLDNPALASDVLLVPHHGSKTSSTPAFIAAVAPSVSIISLGYLNRYHHPHADVLARYAEAGSLLYRTDIHGAIIVNFAKNMPITITPWRAARRRYWHENVVG